MTQPQPLDRPCSQWSLQVSHETHTFFHADGHATCPGWGQPAQPLDLDTIQARCDAARPGPWNLHDDLDGHGYPGHLWIVQNTDDGPDENHLVVSIGDHADGEFIARARTDLPALIARVRELEVTIRMARGLLACWTAEQDHELSYSDSYMGTELGNNAYQRGTTFERCVDELTHVLDCSAMPGHYVDLDAE